jgi:signal transduction histidine kinase
LAGTERADLPEGLATAVFRIFQEMLSKVARHARAPRIQVKVEVDSTALTLMVRDNGCGAPAQAFDAATAYGVKGMRERARHHGGHLTIASELGHGSPLRLRIPLPHAGSRVRA